jgi:hypothetical protein
MTVFCVRQINVILALQALLIAHSVLAQIAMLLIHVSVLILHFMTLSTSAIHPPTIANLALARSALTALLAQQAIVLLVWELTELHLTVPALLADIMIHIPLKSIAYLATRLLVKIVLITMQASALCAMEIIEPYPTAPVQPDIQIFLSVETALRTTVYSVRYINVTGHFNKRVGVAYFFQNFSPKNSFILDSTLRCFRSP